MSNLIAKPWISQNYSAKSHEFLFFTTEREAIGTLRAHFFLFLAYSGLVYAASREKNEKKHTEHERVQFLGTTEHERGLTRTPHGKKHTLNTRRCSFEYY